MKVLHVINSLHIGGAEKLITDSIPIYNKMGLKVDILLLDNSKTAFYELLETKGVNIFCIKFPKNIYNPLNIFSIKKYLKNYDLIHVHLFPAMYWVAFAKIISLKNHKIIFTEHNTTNKRMENPLFKMIDKLVYKQYNQIISISDAVDDKLRQYLGGNFNNISKIYNGINLQAFKNILAYDKEDFGFKNDDIVLTQVSRFFEQKDQKTLIKAVSLLPNHYKLLLVGNGPLQNECLNLCKELKIKDRVLFLGIRSDVPKILKTADIVILSSFYEGLSLSCIEGMSSGKPFIASNVPGLSDIVEDYGVLFELGNSTELSNKIENLIKNKTHYNHVIQKCLMRAKSFDINLMVKYYIKVYNNLI